MPGYFSHSIEKPANSETLTASLVALRDEVSPEVAEHHETIVRREIDRLTLALERIAKAYPCGTMEDMRRVARDAIPASLR